MRWRHNSRSTDPHSRDHAYVLQLNKCVLCGYVWLSSAFITRSLLSEYTHLNETLGLLHHRKVTGMAQLTSWHFISSSVKFIHTNVLSHILCALTTFGLKNCPSEMSTYLGVCVVRAHVAQTVNFVFAWKYRCLNGIIIVELDLFYSSNKINTSIPQYGEEYLHSRNLWTDTHIQSCCKTLEIRSDMSLIFHLFASEHSPCAGVLAKCYRQDNSWIRSRRTIQTQNWCNFIISLSLFHSSFVIFPPKMNSSEWIVMYRINADLIQKHFCVCCNSRQNKFNFARI